MIAGELLVAVTPSEAQDKPRGRNRGVDLGNVINAILYLLRAGCGWRLLLHDFQA